MSKPERGSLTTLLTKKPLGQGAPAAVPLEQAESALLSHDDGAIREAVHTDVRTASAAEGVAGPAGGGASAASHASVHTSSRTDVLADVQPTKLLNRGRKRTVRVPWTFKMPFELREELEAVARFNNLNMTEIAVEAIERHLRYFPHPPDHND
jgi:hypothetical protein